MPWLLWEIRGKHTTWTTDVCGRGEKRNFKKTRILNSGVYLMDKLAPDTCKRSMAYLGSWTTPSDQTAAPPRSGRGLALLAETRVPSRNASCTTGQPRGSGCGSGLLVGIGMAHQGSIPRGRGDHLPIMWVWEVVFWNASSYVDFVNTG